HDPLLRLPGHLPQRERRPRVTAGRTSTETGAASRRRPDPRDPEGRARIRGAALRHVPHLCAGAVAVPDLELGAVGRGRARVVEAASRLRVEERPVGAGLPDLRARAVAGPELHLRSAGGAAAGDVHALAECADRAVAAVPRPSLGVRPVAGPQLDVGAVGAVRAGDVDALAAVAGDLTGAAGACAADAAYAA